MEAADICPNAKRFLGADSPPPELLSSELKKQEKKVKMGLTFPIRFAIIILALKNRKPNQTGKPEKRQKKLKKLLTKTETCDKL